MSLGNYPRKTTPVQTEIDLGPGQDTPSQATTYHARSGLGADDRLFRHLRDEADAPYRSLAPGLVGKEFEGVPAHLTNAQSRRLDGLLVVVLLGAPADARYPQVDVAHHGFGQASGGDDVAMSSLPRGPWACFLL